MRSFLSFHVQAPLEAALAFAQGRTGGAGVYLVPDPPWVSLYHEALEAHEDPGAIQGFLEDLSHLGRALAFLVLGEEDLLFLLAEGGRCGRSSARGRSWGGPSAPPKPSSPSWKGPRPCPP